MMVLIMKTGFIPVDMLADEISAISKSLRVEKRKGLTRLQLAKYNC